MSKILSGGDVKIGNMHLKDVEMMKRALRLAMNGRGKVEPNPMVGCVIVKEGRVIGEGFHARFGEAHAEPNALAACVESPRGATAYVTLEPCCHKEKKTPPCAPRLIEAGIARVVYGCADPNPAVNGNGLEMLRAAGEAVVGPVMEREAKQLIAPFLANVVEQRPYVTLKWAQTADGKVAGAGGRRLRITGERANTLVHHLRARSDAIAVGMGTISEDDPTLLARGVDSPRPLIRAMIGCEDRAVGGNLLKTVDEGRVLLYCADTLPKDDEAAVKLARLGVEAVGVRMTGPHRVDLRQVLSDLHRRGVIHLMVEAGPTMASSFIAENLVDRLWVFRSAKRLEELVVYTKVRHRGKSAPQAVCVPERFVQTGEINLAVDTLNEYLNPHSPVFFAAEKSADLVLAEESGPHPGTLP